MNTARGELGREGRFVDGAIMPSRYRPPAPASSWWMDAPDFYAAARQQLPRFLGQRTDIVHKEPTVRQSLNIGAFPVPRSRRVSSPLPAVTVCTCGRQLSKTHQAKGLVRCDACRRSGTVRTRRTSSRLEA